MKKIITVICVFALTFSISVVLESALKSDRFVNTSNGSSSINLVIDAGHGGKDAGTIGINGEEEKTVNLSIAEKLYDFASVSGISCFMVRNGDYLVYSNKDDQSLSDLYNRLDYVNSIDNSVLISIHQNHFDSEAEWGTQIWYSPNDDNSKLLADNILSVIKDNLQKENKRENKKSDDSYYLLYKATVPSVMVECGFMSNTEENSKLQDDSYQNQMAYSIMLGFCDYQAKG